MARIMEQWEDPIPTKKENKQLCRLIIVSVAKATATTYTVNTGYAFTGKLGFQFLVGYLPLLYASISIVFCLYVFLRRGFKKSQVFPIDNGGFFDGPVLAGVAIFIVFLSVIVWCAIFY